MVIAYATVKSEINTQWGLVASQPNPTIYNVSVRNIDTFYIDRMFIKMFKDMPSKTFSSAGPFTQRQKFMIHGVYNTFALANTAMAEIVRIFLNKGWRIKGKGSITETDKRFVFNLPCYKLQIIQG